jgi:hypothetical protein
MIGDITTDAKQVTENNCDQSKGKAQKKTKTKK